MIRTRLFLTSLAKTSSTGYQAEPLASLPQEKAIAKKPNLVYHPYAQWWPKQRCLQMLLLGSTSQRKLISTSWCCVDEWLFMPKGSLYHYSLFLPSHYAGTRNWEAMGSKVLRQLPNIQGRNELCTAHDLCQAHVYAFPQAIFIHTSQQSWKIKRSSDTMAFHVSRPFPL